MTHNRIVLIHSALADGRVWGRQAALLRDHGYDVVTPDLPGYGNEPVPTTRFSFGDGIVPLLPAVLVGNSFGGHVALSTALSHPADVPALVLVDASWRGHDWSADVISYWEREEALLEQGELDAATELTLSVFAQPHVRDVVRPMQRRAYELQSAVAEPDIDAPELPSLATLTMPVLVLVGEHDLQDFHAIAEQIAREAPNARLEVVARAGHLPALEQPDEFERLLLEFFAEHGI